MKVAYSDRSLDDLELIGRYIALDSPVAAVRMRTRLIEACDGLVNFPQRNPAGRRQGTRELTRVWPYVIVYRVRPDTITVERNLHGARRR